MAQLPRKITLKKQGQVRRNGRASSVSRNFAVEAKGHTARWNELINKGTDYTSNQVEDPFSTFYLSDSVATTGSFNPVAPSYSFDRLAEVVQNSNILHQCIEAYVINVESYGHALEYIGPEGAEDGLPARKEKKLIEGFIASCSATLSLKEIRERSRWDVEITGNRAFEVSRNQRGEIVMFDHIPFNTVRKTRVGPELVEVDVEVPNPAEPSEMVRRRVKRRFCRYVQVAPGGRTRTFFKEFGDPRSISPVTGLVNNNLPIEQQATEILALSLYTPGSFYGLPRWIGQLPAILGSRESELVNLNFFKENAIPAMCVLVSGGALTQDSFDTIEQYINAVRGSKAMNRVMVLEASADESSGNIDQALAAPKIDMKPMISERQQDGLFQNFDDKNQGKVRSSFRLPPIYTGRAEDYTRASAYASMLTAENQIFIPERGSFDDIMNNKILRTYKPKYWRFKSLGAPVSDSDAMSKMIDSFEKAGALTPNAVIKIANKMLGVDIKPVLQKWGDYPFEIVKSYAEQGYIIDGMDDFIDEVATAALNPEPATEPANGGSGSSGTVAPANTNKPPTATVAARKGVRLLPLPERKAKRQIRKEIRIIADDLRSTLQQTLQTNASTEAA